MSLKYGFYDSVDGDRTYSARDFTAIFNNLITDGVLPRTGNRNQFGATPASSGLGVVIDSGWAWFDSTYTFLTAPQTYALDAADAVLYRWDAVVIQTDSENRTNGIVVVKGTPAPESSAVKPTLTANQHPLCYAKVTPGLTKMVQGNIENRVGFSDCPWITGVVGSADLTQVFAQWQYDFDEWFNALQDTLSEDVAGNLQRQISANADKVNQLWNTLGFENDFTGVPVEAGGTGGRTVSEAKSNLGLTGVIRRDAVNGTSSNITTRKNTEDEFQYIYWDLPSAITVQLGAGAIEAIVDITATLHYRAKPSGGSETLETYTTSASYHVYAGYSATKLKNGETPNVSLNNDGVLKILAKNAFASRSTFNGYLYTVSSDIGTLDYTVKYLTTAPSN